MAINRPYEAYWPSRREEGPYVTRDRDLQSDEDRCHWWDEETNLAQTFTGEHAVPVAERFERLVRPVWQALRNAGVRGPAMAAALAPALSVIANNAQREVMDQLQWASPYLSGTTSTVSQRNLTADGLRALQNEFNQQFQNQINNDHALDALLYGMMQRTLETPAQKEAKRVAFEKAKQTLTDCLTPAQRDQFNATKKFTCEVRGKGTFEVNDAKNFSVKHLETGDRYCVVCADPVPIYDQMLTLKLMLENEPDRFFQTANKSRAASEDPYDTIRQRMQREIRDAHGAWMRQATQAPPQGSGFDSIMGARNVWEL